MNTDALKAALIKFATDFAEGAVAGAVAAFLMTNTLDWRGLAFAVILGAVDGAISAARRAVIAGVVTPQK
jgi:hypothetical protein